MSTPTLRIQLLGEFRLSYGDRPITITNSRVPVLLAYLLLHRAAPQSRQHLAFIFWPDSTEARARNSLRQLVFELRRTLPHADMYLEIDISTLQWRSEALCKLDVDEYEQARAEAQRAARKQNLGSEQSALERMIAHYRGDLLPSCYEDWIGPERERLRQHFVEALERVIQLLSEQQNYKDAIVYSQRLLQVDPLHESTYRQLMHLHLQRGDRAGAVRTYHSLATVLRREFDVDPSPEVTQEYERVLNIGTPRVKLQPILVSTAPLVGRAQEWSQLQSAWNQALDGPPQFALLQGEGGMGKTRLAEEFVQWAQRSGITTAVARCYAAEGAPAFAPIVTWMRARPLPVLEDLRLTEVSRFFPEIRAQHPNLEVRPITEPWQRLHLFESLAHAILDEVPSILLVLDDLQWSDRDTLACLEFLLRFDSPTRLFILATLRPEELDPDAPTSRLLHILEHDGRLTRVELEPLDERGTLLLANSVAKQPLEADAGARLYQQTEGNPLFIVETVCAALVDSTPTAESALSPSLPPKIKAVLLRRLEQLSPVSREVVNVAAVIGRDFAFNVLAKASDLDEDHLVQGIDELWRRHIAREHGVDSYDFSHDKLRQVALSNLSPIRKKQLHRRVAQALESLHSKDLDSASAIIAVHYEQAGMADRAIEFYERAAGAARAIYANQEAIEQYEHAIALLPSERDARAARLYEALGDVSDWIGEPEQARRAYEQALLMSESGSILEQARIHFKVGSTFETRLQHEEAHRALDIADRQLAQIRDENDPAWCRQWLETQLRRMDIYYFLHQWQKAEKLVKEVQPILERSGSPAQRIHFLDSLVRVAFSRDRYVVSEESVARRRMALSIAESMRDLPQVASAQFGYGFALLWHGDLSEAETQFRSALESAQRIGNLHLQVLNLTYLTISYRRQGKLAEVDGLVLHCLLTAQSEKTLAYIGISKANLAWVAWHKHDVKRAQDLGQEALELMNSGTPHPFKWLALFVLLDIAVGRGEAAKATEYARMLLDPIQMRLPVELEIALQSAVDSRPPATRRHLLRTVQLAKQFRYL